MPSIKNSVITIYMSQAVYPQIVTPPKTFNVVNVMVDFTTGIGTVGLGEGPIASQFVSQPLSDINLSTIQDIVNNLVVADNNAVTIQ